MTFSASATHALRALAHLAADESGDARLGRDLAREVGVPPHYLAKVLATLARAGVLSASRGVRGGYRLARAPHEITLIEVLEPIEGKRVRPGCLLRPGEACDEHGPCSAHGAWGGVKAAFSTFLETTTLADIQGGIVPPAHDGRRRKRARPSYDSTRSHKRREPTR
jgi:Rrf2 family protein